ncbi:unnamed protein product [Polarella glacialis]|uniref:Uncharacterized protein n=1 Tax=Polarella glacialis TaxID=89957 RepID=A0A813EPL2_POLGL|nr:unnamed protein product [Polarella glacialis]
MRLNAAELIAACSADICQLERSSAHGIAVSEKLADLILSRSNSNCQDSVNVECRADALLAWESFCPDQRSRAASSSARAVEPPVRSVRSSSPRQQLENDEQDPVFAMASILIPALVPYNATIESNLCDYDRALQAAIHETLRVQAEAVEVEGMHQQVSELHEQLSNCVWKMHACAEDDELLSGDALAESLAEENQALRALLFSGPCGDVASDTPQRAASSAWASPSGSRRTSSGGSSPSPPGPLSSAFPLDEFPGCYATSASIVPALPPMPPPSPPPSPPSSPRFVGTNGDSTRARDS